MLIRLQLTNLQTYVYTLGVLIGQFHALHNNHGAEFLGTFNVFVIR